MKKVTAKISSKKDMNELVDYICEHTGVGSKDMRDKFKMLDKPNSTTLQNMCKLLKLDVMFNNTQETKTVSVLIPNKPVERKQKKEENEMEDMLKDEETDLSNPNYEEFTSVNEEEDEDPFA